MTTPAPHWLLYALIICGTVASLVLSAGLAFADGPRPGGGSVPTLGNGGPTVTSVNVAKVSAGPARPGVSQKTCDAYAAGINATIGLQMEAQHNYDPELAGAYAYAVEDAKNLALDAGCFVIE